MRRPSRVLTALTAIALLAGAGVIAAPAASAAPSPNAIYIGKISSGSGCVSGNIVVSDITSTTVSQISGTDGTLTVYNMCGGTIYLYVPGTTGSGDLAAGQNTTFALSSATTTFEIYQATGGSTAWVTIPISVSSGGGGGGSTTAASEGASVPAALTLDVNAVDSSGTCTGESVISGYTGDWLTLPSAAECTGKAGAVLLGWSTSASFPVAIAQRQADHKWGTYKLTDAEGKVTAVFIPAGWEAFVTGTNTLYPIWSK